VSDIVERLPKRRVWLWKPQFYWHGWRTLLPISFGGDEWDRRTLMFGFTVTGRIIIALPWFLR
jgi:hypothetical protein